MNQTNILNTSYYHRVAHKITNQMCKDKQVLISPGGMLQKGYIEDGTKNIRKNNAGYNNADAAQIKIKPPTSKK